MVYEKLKMIPTNVKILIFFGVFLLCALGSYLFFEDTKLLEKRIFSRQKELFLTLQLRDSYESKKHVPERTTVKPIDQSTLSLALIEDMVGKTFTGGRLTQLQPLTAKEGKGDHRSSVEIKVSGAPLNEVVLFVRAAENSGFQIGKMRLSLPANNPMALDMQAIIVERRSHG